MWSKPIAPLLIHCDSAATLAKAYSQVYNGKSRHLGVRHSMVRDLNHLIKGGVISVEFVRSQQNLVDHLTKGLARDLYNRLPNRVLKGTVVCTSMSTVKVFNIAVVFGYSVPPPINRVSNLSRYGAVKENMNSCYCMKVAKTTIIIPHVEFPLGKILLSWKPIQSHFPVMNPTLFGMILFQIVGGPQRCRLVSSMALRRVATEHLPKKLIPQI